jgi:hypothetical protein
LSGHEDGSGKRSTTGPFGSFDDHRERTGLRRIRCKKGTTGPWSGHNVVREAVQMADQRPVTRRPSGCVRGKWDLAVVTEVLLA